jgi:hypothetical protein
MWKVILALTDLSIVLEDSGTRIHVCTGSNVVLEYSEHMFANDLNMRLIFLSADRQFGCSPKLSVLHFSDSLTETQNGRRFSFVSTFRRDFFPAIVTRRSYPQLILSYILDTTDIIHTPCFTYIFKQHC